MADIKDFFRIAEDNDSHFIMNLKLANVPLNLWQGFTWSDTSGVEPFTGSYVDRDETINKIWNAANGEGFQKPVSLEYFITLLSSDGIHFFDGTIDNIYILERQLQHRRWSSLILTDARYFLKNIQFPVRINMKKPVPEKDLIDFEQSLLKDWYSLPTWAYYKQTVQEDGKPYTCAQVADIMLKKYLRDYQGISANDPPADSAPDDMDLFGLDITGSLPSLLLKARLELGRMPEGGFMLYDVDNESYFENNLNAAGLTKENKNRRLNPTSGTIYESSKKFTRSVFANIGFEQEWEILCEFSTSYSEKLELMYDDESVNRSEFGESEGGQEGREVSEINENKIVTIPAGSGEEQIGGLLSGDDINKDQNKVFLKADLINVAPAPFRMTLANGREVAPGTWLPVNTYLDEWNISEDTIRENWFGHYWKWELLIQALEQSTDFADIDLFRASPEFIAKVSLIQQHWSQTFMVDPLYSENVLRYSNERVAIYDSVSGTRLKVFCWMNHTVFPHIIPPKDFMEEHGIEPSNYKFGENIEHAPINDSIEDVVKKQISPFTVEMIDNKNGIFSIKPIQDAHGVNYQFIFRDCVEDTIPPVPKQLDSSVFMNTELKPNWRLVVMLSARFLTPNNRKNIYWLQKPSHDYGMDGNPQVSYEKIPRTTVARRQINVEELEDIDEQVDVDPVNLPILKAVAESEAGVYYHQKKDRLAGHETYNGVYKIQLFGNIQAITYNFGNGGATTHISSDTVPPMKDMIENIPRDIRRRLTQRLPLDAGG